VVVIDDTFNANPAGARVALSALAATGAARRVLVTPGMVELGRRQAPENRRLAEAAAEQATDLVIVGLTNRRALVSGAEGRAVVLVGDRAAAVDWVRSNLRSGDAVLYENDLPDHYP
jgi:UDP-N-acetylmuramoyl-tripeptide--D-alanyl-D-alanine ligase